jgi:hypothetical protein
MVTGIGSFPFTDVDEAIDLIFSSCREIPFWPQLPQKSPWENMYVPFLESVPSAVIDESRGAAYVNTEETRGIERFYEDVQNGRLEAFRISERMAPGFYRFLERLGEIREDVRFIKTQLTGPFSMGFGLQDEKGKPVIYNDSYFDIIKKALHMKALWMIEEIRSRYPEKPVIIFFDEPFLVSFGSAYVSVSKGEVIAIFDEVFGGVPARRGVHCCGNTDWPVLLNADVDIINYDAYNFMETIFYFEEELRRFVHGGGRFAPGIVPSDPAVAGVTLADVEGLRDRFRQLMLDTVGPEGTEDLMVTPSCGLGSLTNAQARLAMELLGHLARTSSL